MLDKDRGKIVFVQYVICYISMLTTKYLTNYQFSIFRLSAW